MTGPRSSEIETGAASEFPDIEFGRSSENFAAARVGDNVFAMLPMHNRGHYLATGWKITRPLDNWKRTDFYGHSGRIADEADFRAKVLENAEHQREKKALGRRETHSRAHTLWGTSQGTIVYADGVESHSTASHGGFKLSATRNREVHPMLRAKGGWYEEDCAWAAVAITFPHLFTGFERRCAEKTLKDWWPDAWEAIFCTVLAPGESYQKDRRAFEAVHAADWVAIAAIRSDHHPGMTEVTATRGGSRDHYAEERRFLVPSGEYDPGRFGFVIDEVRHAPCEGPSSFVGSSRLGTGR